MVKVREDLTGRVFGRLKVLEQAEDYIDPKTQKTVARWLCECSCENHTLIIVRGNALKTGHTTSCGCYNKERSIETHKKYNKYDLSGEYGIGWTSNTNREFYFDLEDYDKIKDYCWCEYLVQNRYSTLRTNKDGKYINMHQLLGFKYYDHIDRNELNNRKNNLRLCTERQNHMNRSLNRNNTSGITGVNWDKSVSRWKAYIGINNKYINLGSFIIKYDAIICRLQAEAKYYGEFAPQRHLFQEYGITLQSDCEDEK